MSEREAAFVRFVDLKQQKRRIELELRLQEIERELDLITAPWSEHAAPVAALQAA